MNRRLIVNADDYGRTPSVSRGILDAHLNGIVTTTTVMINLPGALEDVRRGIEYAPTLAFGVHLNLTCGKPLTPPDRVTTLIDANGWFHGKNQIFNNPEMLDLAQVKMECKAQIERFLQTETKMDHLDSHHHLGIASKGIWNLLTELAIEYDCGVRTPFANDILEEDLPDLYPASMIDFSRTQAKEQLETFAIPHPDYFYASFFGDKAVFDHLIKLLQDLPAGVSEIMCHPGYSDEKLEQTSGYNIIREQELAVLTNQGAHTAIASGNIELHTFRTGCGK
ncbi:MAG: ChbG/HpnK family deacetylase [Anaerolineales bacterium]|nr:ChbG/HpnK family deacetylase [Anaerolineales bacterium]